ncbi:MAG: hypothetical protein JW731_10505 [Bacteroidales bacterium]|nr:hypothetical protein [Bacteroidales bacterium]
MTVDGFYKMIRTNNLKTSRLLQLSQILNYDLFIHYSPITPDSHRDHQSPINDALLTENQNLKLKIEILQKEVDHLKTINQLLSEKLN